MDITHFDELTDQQIDDIRERHLRAEHCAEEECEFVASNAHHDRGILLEQLDRLRDELAMATATARPGLASGGLMRLRKAG